MKFARCAGVAEVRLCGHFDQGTTTFLPESERVTIKASGPHSTADANMVSVVFIYPSYRNAGSMIPQICKGLFSILHLMIRNSAVSVAVQFDRAELSLCLVLIYRERRHLHRHGGQRVDQSIAGQIVPTGRLAVGGGTGHAAVNLRWCQRRCAA